MPSKKRKYNARFPAGRIKKIMQTDEEVGKVAQAVPIIISRTLELFVESLLKKAMQVTLSRNAKTLSPSHVKQCILAESRFDFLRDLVKNIPDVSVAEEKELLSEENSPNTSRFPETAAPRRVARQDSNSSSSSDVKPLSQSREVSEEKRLPRTETVTLTTLTPVTSEAMDLTKKIDNRPNFYQETLNLDERQGVIKLNPTYAAAQPSTSSFATNPLEQIQRIAIPLPKQNSQPLFHIDLSKINNNTSKVKSPVTPVLNIDFTKNVENPEIQVLEPTMKSKPVRQYTRIPKPVAVKEKEMSVSKLPPTAAVDVDLSAGNLQIDEDYDT